jgi:hypothetical protein
MAARPRRERRQLPQALLDPTRLRDQRLVGARVHEPLGDDDRLAQRPGELGRGLGVVPEERGQSVLERVSEPRHGVQAQ